MTPEERRLSVVSNAIGYELFAYDGRELEDGKIHVFPAEVELSDRIAKRVLRDLEELDNE